MSGKPLLTLLLILALVPYACAPARSAPQSGRRTVLVELFTSQGCSSCPAADALVRDLPCLGLGRDRVLPLTFHVDYWDDLGWKDRFAAPAFTDRQRWYASFGKLRGPLGPSNLTGLYTPQMIVDGTVHFSGARRALALAEIERASQRPPVTPMQARATLEGDTALVTVLTGRPSGANGPWRLFVALTTKSAKTRVTRGENQGETLQEAAIVRALSAFAPISLPTSQPFRTAIRKPEDLSWADVEITAFLQSDSTRQVGAACAVMIDSDQTP